MSDAPSVVSVPGPGLAPAGKVAIVVVGLVGVLGVGVAPGLIVAAGLAVVFDVVAACILFRRATMQAMMAPVATEGQPVAVRLRHPDLREDVRLSVDHDVGRAVGVRDRADETSITITAPHRGIYPALAVRGVVVGPLGLGSALRRWSVPLREPHAVVPRSERVDEVVVTSRPDVELSQGVDVTEAADHLREHRPGDALRSVNWAASSRHGELLVRTAHGVRRTIRMAVDLGPSRDHAEVVARTAMSIGTAVLSRGDVLRLDLCVAGHHVGAEPVQKPRLLLPYLARPLDTPSEMKRVSAEVTDVRTLGVILAAAGVTNPIKVGGEPWPGDLDDGRYDVILSAQRPTATPSGASSAGGTGHWSEPPTRRRKSKA